MEQKYKRLEELSKWFEEERKKIFEELKQDIQQLTNYQIELLSKNICRGWEGQRAQLRAEVNFVKQNMEFDFGSDFDIHFIKNELRFNYGCLGNFGKESVYYIERTKLMAKLFDKWEELETKYLGKLNNPTFSEYFNLSEEIDWYERQRARELKEKAFNDVFETIKPGNEYYQGKEDDYWHRVTKITKARVYYVSYFYGYNGKPTESGEKYESHSQFVNAIQSGYYRLKED